MFILYFSKLHFIFYKFLKFIPIFWNITKNKKNQKPLHTVSGRLRPMGLALLAWPARPLGAGAVTASTTIAVARPGRARRWLLGDEVGSVRTTVRQATRWARSCGWELTEAVGRWRGGRWCSKEAGKLWWPPPRSQRSYNWRRGRGL
jgi:hypothetical protein